MKHLIFLFFLSSFVFSQHTQKDPNTGVISKYSSNGNILERYTLDSNGKYHGKITWMLNPLDENGNPKTDPLNPDESLQSRSRMGMVIMYSFEYDSDNKWDNGNIYDPKSGNEYSGTMTLTSKNRLDLRGYVGIPIFGRTSNWSRKLD